MIKIGGLKRLILWTERFTKIVIDLSGLISLKYEIPDRLQMLEMLCYEFDK